MTRNNLSEHLSWLLNSKPSVPPTTTPLPPAATSFSSISTTQLEDLPDLSHEAPDTPTDRPKRRDIENIAEAAGGEDMVRMRTAPGSASRPRMGIAEKVSPLPTPSKLMAFPRSPTVEFPTSSSKAMNARRSPQKHPKSERRSRRDDIEVMDLTDSMNATKSPSSRQIVTPVNSRKRKSEEYEADLKGFPPSLRSPIHQPVTRSGSHHAPDNHTNSATSPSQCNAVPVDPPPPYSTHAQESKTSMEPPHRLPPKSHHRDSSGWQTLQEDSDDDIVNFTNPKSKEAFPSAERSNPMTYSRIPEKDDDPPAFDTTSPTRHFANEKKFLSTGGTIRNQATPESSVPEVSVEEASLLKQLFSLPESVMKEAIDGLHHHRDKVCFELTEGLDEDLDVSHLERQLDELDVRVDAVNSLWNKRSLYRTLSDEKDRLKDALLQAVRARHGVDAAKSANLAGKEKLKKLEAECSTLLTSCRQDVNGFLINQSVVATRAEVRHNVAVQSTQSASKLFDLHTSSAPSSSRIAQTQYDTMMPPPATRLVNAATSKPSNSYAQSRENESVRFDVDEIMPHDDFPDESDQLHVNSRKQKGFSNRMGTPPERFDNDEEFGLDDDDDMLAWAQDLENRSGPPRATPSSAKRPALAETSGNSHTKYHATAVKRARQQAEEPDDLAKRHFIHPWSNDVKATLKQRFKLKGFRQGQVEAINATLAGKDVFVLMPTGGGKSLCYQLPSLITSGKSRGVTIVVSPLMSLMEDQVRHLTALGIQAFLFNSETSKEERSTLLTGLQDPNVEKYIQVLYVTPELLSVNQRMISSLDRLHRNERMARLVIDEAHCVSQWGHDFRPDYKALGDVRRRYPGVPVMALTATATENVKADTIHNLSIDGCEVFSRSFNRPNLYYEIRAKTKGKGDIESIASLIKEKYHRQCGIIYCFSRRNCETVAEDLLKNHRIKAHHYHAGMEAAAKSQVQQEWQAGNYHVIVATIAFGMGIDKPNVRFVIHHSLPKSLEGYYQETGRAGRDGKRSDCYLYFGYQDASKLRRMIDEDEAPWEQKERQRQMLRKMVQFCDNESDCRRVQILAYFNEKFSPEDCGGFCDNCNSDSAFEDIDFTQHAQRAINLVRTVESGKVTILHCIEVYRGADTKKIRDCGHNALDDYAAGKKLEKGDVVRLFYRLISEGALREVQYFNKSKFAQSYVQLGENWNSFGPGKERLIIQTRVLQGWRPSKAVSKQQSKSETTNDTTRRGAKASREAMSHRGLPASTNVSSPVQPARSNLDRARQSRQRQTHLNGYAKDAFVVSDPEDDDYGTESEAEAFEPIPKVTRPAHSRTRPDLGPPITTDAFMDGLSDIHRCIVEQFVEKAADLGKAIMTKKNLHMVPFSDTILREMASRFTETEDEMCSIPGIDPAKVEAHGKQFCRLVAQSHRQYQELVASEERNNDKHAQNVIDLVSDEEDDDEEEAAEEGLGEEEEDFGSLDGDFEAEFNGLDHASSSYFPQQDRDVAAFNAKFMNSQSVGMRSIAASQPPPKAPKAHRKTRYTAKTRNASGSGQNYTRRNHSGEFERFRLDSGSISKKKKATTRSGNKASSQSASRGASRPSAKTSKKTASFSIPTMPT